MWFLAPGKAAAVCADGVLSSARSNLFHALCLYVHAVAKEERGVLEMISLNEACPDLLRIVGQRN